MVAWTNMAFKYEDKWLMDIPKSYTEDIEEAPSVNQ